MENLILLGLILSTLIIGFFRVRNLSTHYIKERDFLYAFNNKFIEYVNSHGTNIDAYQWLMENSEKMQIQLGARAIASHKPAFMNVIYHNYLLIVNGLPEIRKGFADHDNTVGEYIAMINDALLKEKGSLGAMFEKLDSWQKNPFIWIREGVRTLVSLPINLLYWFGLISENRASKISNSFIFKVISLLLTLIGLLSSIVGLVTGWDIFIQTIKTRFNIP